MFSPIDDRIRVFHKGLTGQGGFASDLFQYEDPTYLGFYFIFDFDPIGINPSTGLVDNALFAEPGAGIDSAQQYLRAIGYPAKAEKLKQFKEGMRYINKIAPYYFQTLEGVPDLWKINKKAFGFEPNKALEKFVTIGCLESIDLRMTALADLYMKATFDEDNMRDLLPSNLKRFTVDIMVAEMRKFHRVKEIVETNITQAPQNSFETRGGPLEELNDLISVIKFKCSKCEFDFSESFPTEELNMAGDMQMAKQKIKINIGNVTQRNSYRLLDLYLSDFVSVSGNAIKEDSVVGSGKFSKINKTSVNDESDKLRSKIEGYDQGLNSSNLFNGAISTLQDQARGFSQQLGNLGPNAVAGALGNLQSQITGLALGNVHDDRNRSLTELINGFTNESDQIRGIQRGEDVFPNSPGADTTTRNSNDLGNAH